MQKLNENWQCWDYDLLQVVLDVRTAYDRFKEICEREGLLETIEQQRTSLFNELEPVLDKYEGQTLICTLLGICGSRLELALDAYAERRTLDNLAGK